MTRKWIINDDDLILGDVEFHEDLLTGDRKQKNTVGGGRWHIDTERDIIFFWGKSIDFGQATKKEFDYAFKQPSVEHYETFFSLKTDFNDVLKEYEIYSNVIKRK
jgi:hypothetical protein